MTTIDTYFFAAICCEAVFGLLVTILLLRALISTIIYGWSDEERPKLSGLKPSGDSRVRDGVCGETDGRARQGDNENELSVVEKKKRRKIGTIIVLMFIIGLVLGGWLFYCLFPNTAISKDTLRQTTEKFEAAQLDEDGYGMGKNYFEAPIEYGGRKMFKVGGVLDNGDALATEVTSTANNYISTLNGTQVVLEHSPEQPYYDSQVVSVPEGKAVMQVGVYRSQSYGSVMRAEDLLSSGSGSVKTLPLLAIQ